MKKLHKAVIFLFLFYILFFSFLEIPFAQVNYENNSIYSSLPLLFNEVSSICALGAPGPLSALNSSPIPIVTGDNDTTPIPSVVAMASSKGDGRVLAVAHKDFFTNEAISLFDNGKFAHNIIDWLDKLGTHNVLVTTGHNEWYGGSNFDQFKAELEGRGYTVNRFSGKIEASALLEAGVVLIGNIWGEILDSEIETLTNFVTNGGGLFLVGLGWSWEFYNPGFTLDDYPMNKIAESYGIRWIDGGINDPTNNYEGQPIFSSFYPNTYPKIIIYQMNIPLGWSMISLPIKTFNSEVKNLFPDAVIIYGYKEGIGYVRINETDQMEAGKGYWILLKQETNYTLVGMEINEYSFQVQDEWYMIGGCSSASKALSDNCSIGVIYGYFPGVGYKRLLATELLEPGKGYWMLINTVMDQASLKVGITDSSLK